jgi:hypothetical protein
MIFLGVIAATFLLGCYLSGLDDNAIAYHALGCHALVLIVAAIYFFTH